MARLPCRMRRLAAIDASVRVMLAARVEYPAWAPRELVRVWDQMRENSAPVLEVRAAYRQLKDRADD